MICNKCSQIVDEANQERYRLGEYRICQACHTEWRALNADMLERWLHPRRQARRGMSARANAGIK